MSQVGLRLGQAGLSCAETAGGHPYRDILGSSENVIQAVRGQTRRRVAASILLLALLMGSDSFAQERSTVVLETSKGAIKIELFVDVAPKTVDNFLRYVDMGFYTDTIFHRVIPKFVVQGGGFTPELELKPTLEPTPIETKNGLTNDRGTVAMARTDDKDSATSQFFINLADNEALNRSAFAFGYTVFGRVTEGMEIVDAIARVQTSTRGPMEDVPILPVFLDRAYRAP